MSTLQGIIDSVRYRLNNFEVPYIWLDSELVSYANDIQNQICREALCLEDSKTVSVCDISTVIDQYDYALDSSIIYVRDVLFDTDVNLPKVTKMDMDTSYPAWRTATHDRPTRYLLDYNTGYITLYPKPNDVYTLHLSVYRYPITAFTTTNMSAQVPEIDAKYHTIIVDGICSLALLKRGENTYDPKSSANFFALYQKGIKDIKVRDNRYKGTGATSQPARAFM